MLGVHEVVPDDLWLVDLAGVGARWGDRLCARRCSRSDSRSRSGERCRASSASSRRTGLGLRRGRSVFVARRTASSSGFRRRAARRGSAPVSSSRAIASSGPHGRAVSAGSLGARRRSASTAALHPVALAGEGLGSPVELGDALGDGLAALPELGLALGQLVEPASRSRARPAREVPSPLRLRPHHIAKGRDAARPASARPWRTTGSALRRRRRAHAIAGPTAARLDRSAPHRDGPGGTTGAGSRSSPSRGRPATSRRPGRRQRSDVVGRARLGVGESVTPSSARLARRSPRRALADPALSSLARAELHRPR